VKNGVQMELGVMTTLKDRRVRFRQFVAAKQIADEDFAKERTTQAVLFQNIHDQRYAEELRPNAPEDGPVRAD
jgi:hypothetical protein